jgi:pimeloyl-ACP methyl ester carboxylesterase
MNEATRQSASVNGITLSYFDVGAGEPVLLLHGFPDDALIWGEQLKALVAAGYRCIVPDLRGYGESDAPVDRTAYRASEVVADLIGLLDHLALPHVSLIGHDWGSVIGWILVGNHADRVKRYVALSVGHPNAYARAGLRQKLKGYYIFIFKTPRFAEWALLRNNGAALRRIAPSEAVANHWVESMQRPGRLTAALNYYRANGWWLGYLASPRIHVPVLGVWSDQDVALAEDQMVNSARYMAADWRYQRVEGAAHWLMVSRAAQVNAMILSYLAEPIAAR